MAMSLETTFTDIIARTSFLRPKIKARSFFAAIGCLALLCTSCATQKVIKKSQDLEVQGDYKGAYTNIVEGLRASPKNEKLLAQKTHISELYAQDLVRSAAQLPTNDLPEKIQILESASQLESGNHDEIIRTLTSLQEQRQEIFKHADVLVASTNLADMVAGVEMMSNCVSFDADLRKKLIDDPNEIAHVAKLLTQMERAPDLRETRRLALRCWVLWHCDDIKRIDEEIDARLRRLGIEALLPPLASDASLGNKTVYCLIRAILAPDNQTAEAYQQTSKQLGSDFLPVAKIHLQGALSVQQRDALQSAILRPNVDSNSYFESSTDTNIPDILLIINVTDVACKPTAEDHVVYSKFYAGDTQRPNPNYDSLYIQYQQILANAQSAGNAYAMNPNLINAIIAGKTRGNANNAATILANTPRYVNVPVYEDYQLKQRDLVAECRLQADIQAFDGISGTNLCNAPIEDKENFQFKEFSDAHPKDVNRYVNKSAPSNWGEDCLQNFVNSHLGEVAQKVTALYEESVMDTSAKFIKQNREQLGVEMALAWAVKSEGGQAIERNQEVAEIRDLQRQFDKVCFGEDGTSFVVLRTNIIKCIMAQFGGIISQQNQWVGDIVAKTDPMLLQRSQTVLVRPTQDLSASLLSVGRSPSTAKTHITPSIAAASHATVTVFTDQGTGSGFIISTNGFIVTNNHVIEGATRVLVAGSDGKKISAEVVDFNTSRDLAILKVVEGNWIAVQLGDVDSIAIGEPVYAIGSPADVPEGTLLDQTVTRGVVSGIREFPSDSNPNIKVEYIQTDAAINAGNSGGPLVDEAGKVIGVNNQKIVGRGVEGLNFSISINEVKKLYFRYLND